MRQQKDTHARQWRMGIIANPGKEKFREATCLPFYFFGTGIFPDELFLSFFTQIATPVIAPAGKTAGRGTYFTTLIII